MSSTVILTRRTGRRICHIRETPARMRPQHDHGITPLNCNRNMLTKKNCGSRFLSNSIDLNPRSADSFQAASPHVPKVSTTTGTTSWGKLRTYDSWGKLA